MNQENKKKINLEVDNIRQCEKFYIKNAKTYQKIKRIKKHKKERKKEEKWHIKK